MKSNQLSKDSKTVSLPPVRVSMETAEKLTAMSKKAVKSKSAIIRELIEKGEVKTIFNGKEVMRAVANTHREFNQYSLKMSENIQFLREDINRTKELLEKHGAQSGLFQIYLEKALLRLDSLQTKYDEKLTVCTRVLSVRSDEYGNF